MDTPTTTPPHAEDYGKPDAPWRRRLYRVVFESDTRTGQLFDIAVIAAVRRGRTHGWPNGADAGLVAGVAIMLATMMASMVITFFTHDV